MAEKGTQLTVPFCVFTMICCECWLPGCRAECVCVCLWCTGMAKMSNSQRYNFHWHHLKLHSRSAQAICVCVIRGDINIYSWIFVIVVRRRRNSETNQKEINDIAHKWTTTTFQQMKCKMHGWLTLLTNDARYSALCVRKVHRQYVYIERALRFCTILNAIPVVILYFINKKY